MRETTMRTSFRQAVVARATEAGLSTEATPLDLTVARALERGVGLIRPRKWRVSHRNKGGRRS